MAHRPWAPSELKCCVRACRLRRFTLVIVKLATRIRQQTNQIIQEIKGFHSRIPASTMRERRASTSARASAGRPAPPPPVRQVELLAPPLRPEFQRPLSGWSVALRLKIPSMKARRSMAGIPTFSSCGRQATKYGHRNDQVACRRRFGCWEPPLNGILLTVSPGHFFRPAACGCHGGMRRAPSGMAVRSEVVAARGRELQTGISAAVGSQVGLEESAWARRLRRLGGTSSPGVQ